MRYAIGVLAAVVCLLPAWASEPGEPLDCSDWVILEPGLFCATEIAFPCGGVSAQACDGAGTNVDVHGNHWYTRSSIIEFDACGWFGINLRRLEIVRAPPDGSEAVVAYIDDRCAGFELVDHVTSSGFGFDIVNGRAIVGWRSFQSAGVGITETYVAGQQRARITGFTTLFEVLQSYTPTSGPISFRVPYMPEGFQDADSFDTYTGPLTNSIDFSQAQPLKCDYPATAPTTGDYLTIADPLPDPAPGTGRYYVTAVSYQGQTRYGRKNIGGLSGRDPGVLPACAE